MAKGIACKLGCSALAALIVFAFAPLCSANASSASSAAATTAANASALPAAGVNALARAFSASSACGEAVIGQSSNMVWDAAANAYKASFTAPQHLIYAMCNNQGVEGGTFTIRDSSGKTLVSQSAWDYELTPFTLKKGEQVSIEVTEAAGHTHWDEDETLSLYTQIVGIPSDSADYGNLNGSWDTSSKAKISTVASKVTDATYDMLANYVSAGHLDLATTVRSSAADAKTLKKLAASVTAQGGTDTQKAIRMALWSAHNVKYDYGVAYGAIDTFYNRKADCKGFAALTAELMRLAGIPAVFVAGYNATDGGGLAKTTFSKANESGDYNHAWVYAYTDGQWRMYDPLFGVYASTDKAAQSKNYYPWYVEGITPTYDGEDLSIAGDSGFGFFLIDQRVIFFANGKPNSMLDGGFSPNLMLDFDGVAMFGTPLDANRSCTYWEGDSQWAGREFDTCYLNELLAGAPVQDGLSAFARNSAGIFYAGSFPVDAASGEQLFITYNGSALRFLGNVDGVQLSAGRPVIEVGKAARLLLPAEYFSSDYRVEFYVQEGSDLAAYTSVSADGTVTCTRAGNVWVNYSVYASDDGRLMGGGDIQYTACKAAKRTANYKDDPSKWIRNPEVPGVTDGTRLAVGAAITSGKLKYTVLAGQRTVSVKVASSAAKRPLKSLVIPATVKDKKGNSYQVTAVAKNGFKGCSKLAKVTCKGASKLENIGAGAFNGCAKLGSVSITSGKLASIGSGAFSGTKSLTSVAMGLTTALKSVTGAFKSAGKSGGKKLVVKVAASKLAKYKALILAKGGNKKLTVKQA